MPPALAESICLSAPRTELIEWISQSAYCRVKMSLNITQAMPPETMAFVKFILRK